MQETVPFKVLQFAKVQQMSPDECFRRYFGYTNDLIDLENGMCLIGGANSVCISLQKKIEIPDGDFRKFSTYIENILVKY